MQEKEPETHCAPLRRFTDPAYQPLSDFELGQPGYGQDAAATRQGAR